MKYALKHTNTKKYVECLGGDGIFNLCEEVSDAARFNNLSSLIRFIAGHRKEIQDYTIIGLKQAEWQECSPFHPTD